MKISDILSEEGIDVDLKGTSKSELLDELIELLKNGNHLNQISEIKKAIHERENLSSTGIGNGLAIPHAKVKEIDKIYLSIGISKKGIDFHSIDHKPCHIFVILISPKEDHGNHVKTLAKITKLLRDEEWRQELIKCKNSKEVIDFIYTKENLFK